jgi:hypothetical protein
MTSLPDATAGVAYTGQATASGGVLPYSYAKTAGPSWMSVNAGTGAITGTPDADGTGITVTVTVTDAALADEPVTDTMDVAWAPYVLFLAAEKGVVFDASALGTVWEDSSGTVPASVDGAIGRWSDQTANAKHAIQATTANKATLRTGSSLYYAEFDDVDDFYQTAAIDFSGTDKVTVFTGVRKTSDNAFAALCELTASVATVNGGFALTAPNGTDQTFGFRSRGTATGGAIVSGQAAPVTRVLTGVGHIAGPLARLRIDGVATDDATSQGTGNYASAVFNIGRRNGTTGQFGGRIYALIVLGREATADEITKGEAWIASKCGVTL